MAIDFSNAPNPQDPQYLPVPLQNAPQGAPLQQDLPYPFDAPVPAPPQDVPVPTFSQDVSAPTFPFDAPAPVFPQDAPAPTFPFDAPAPVFAQDASAPTFSQDAPAPVYPRGEPALAYTQEVPALVFVEDDPSLSSTQEISATSLQHQEVAAYFQHQEAAASSQNQEPSPSFQHQEASPSFQHQEAAAFQEYDPAPAYPLDVLVPAYSQETPVSPYPEPFPGQAMPPLDQPTYAQSSAPAIPLIQRLTSKGMFFLVGLIGVFVGAAISVGALAIATSGFSFSGTIDPSTIVIDSAATDIELPVIVAAKVTPSVVNIDVYASTNSFLLEDFFGGGMGSTSPEEEQTGLGSGVILTADGYILTNYHVVVGGERFLVRLGNEDFEATVVGSDPSSDLAVLKVEAQGLTPIKIGDSESVQVGQWVMAVGSPFGLEKSVSIGIVSALYRSTALQSQSGLSIFANLIQTDAAINPGNSGGALVNSAGELIGINTLINTTSGSSAGVGFAVPSNFAYSVALQIMNGETVAHPFLGISLYTVDSSNAQELGVQTHSGAYVESVQPGSPAEAAGVLPGDVITSVDNTNISTSAELIIEIRRKDIGDTVKLGINRGGQTQSINVVLGSTTG